MLVLVLTRLRVSTFDECLVTVETVMVAPILFINVRSIERCSQGGTAHDSTGRIANR